MQTENKNILVISKSDAFPDSLSPRKVLVVMAHSDDSEINCGGLLARWSETKAEITYVVCTNGDKGTWDKSMTSQRLAVTRQDEQKAAAVRLGIADVIFLPHEDGFLWKERAVLEEKLVEIIRKRKPEVLLTHDGWKSYDPNPDHGVAGLTAVYATSAACGPLFYPRQLPNLDVHLTKTVLLFDTQTPNLVIDISNVIERKMEAINNHKTQSGTRQRFMGELRQQFANTGRPFGFDYAETYHVLELR